MSAVRKVRDITGLRGEVKWRITDRHAQNEDSIFKIGSLIGAVCGGRCRITRFIAEIAQCLDLPHRNTYVDPVLK